MKLRLLLLLLTLGCSSVPIEPPDSGTHSDASPADVSSPETAPQGDASAPEADPPDAAVPIFCMNFTSLIVDADIPQACTGSNWTWDDVNGSPEGPCSSAVCPLMQGRACTWNGDRGYVCCPGHGCP